MSNPNMPNRANVPPVPSKPLDDDEVVRLRAQKVELNRHSRRQLGMPRACQGMIENKLVCEIGTERCPDFDVCHSTEAGK